MAEEKKYTFWNGNDWATNHILSEDPLRAIDLSNDTQILSDFITGNPDGEKQRAAKNFEHMMGISGYSPKEVAFNTATNVAPDVVFGGLLKLLIKGGKSTGKGIRSIVDKAKNNAIKKKTFKTKKSILEALEQGEKVDKKYFQNNEAIKNINKTLGDEGGYNMIKDSVKADIENIAPDNTNKIIKYNLGLRGKNDYADVLLEPFLKEDDYLKNITHDNAKFLLGNAGERFDDTKGLSDTIDVIDDIMKDSDQTKTFQDVVRANNDAFARNSKRVEDAYKSGKISIRKKWELDQLNKLNYYNASSRIINDTLIKESVIKNPIKLFGKIPLGKEKVKTTYINDFDMVRPFRHMPNGSKAKNFWAYLDLAKEVVKAAKKPTVYEAIKSIGKAARTGISKTTDNIILPTLADIVHADMDNPNRYNEADIMDTWELVKRDNDAGLLKDRGGKPLVIPENPSVREIIDFIKRRTPEADKKRWYEEIQNNRLKEVLDPQFMKDYGLDKMSAKEIMDFLSTSPLVDDEDREILKDHGIFITKPKKEEK